ncbi:MAG: TIGR00730 family Rossman fold protein [Myxococcota bacterium]
MHRVCVFCASSTAASPSFRAAARRVGEVLAARGIGLVYGGGRVGLMGEVAEGALAAGGEVVGVIPEKLQGLELARRDLTRLEVVPDMHARKRRMADLSDAFVALPGGYGTLEELFEAVTWTQLNYHLKPVGILNVEGFFDHVVAFLGRAAAEGLVRRDHVDLLLVDTAIEALLDRLAAAELPALERWIDDV